MDKNKTNKKVKLTLKAQKEIVLIPHRNMLTNLYENFILKMYF